MKSFYKSLFLGSGQPGGNDAVEAGSALRRVRGNPRQNEEGEQLTLPLLISCVDRHTAAG